MAREEIAYSLTWLNKYIYLEMTHHFHSRFTSQSESDNQVATPDVNGAESTVLHRKWSDMEGLTIF